MLPVQTCRWGHERRNAYHVDRQVKLKPEGTLESAAAFVLSSNLGNVIRPAVASADSRRHELPGRRSATLGEAGFGSSSNSDPRNLSQPFS